MLSKSAVGGALHHGQDVQVLSCDGNLAPLVVFLFMAAYFLFASLQTGIHTTRVMARMARDGCVDPSRRKLSSPLKRMRSATQSGVYLTDILAHGQRWALSLTATKSKLAGIPNSIKRRVQHVRAQRKQRKEKQVLRWSSTRVNMVKYAIPYRFISHYWGKLTQIPLPFVWLRRAIYLAWTNAYNCKLEEARYPVESYTSLSKFFLRPLKDGVRKVDMSEGTMVSPVDGKVLHVGGSDMSDLSNVRLEQVKGVSYALDEFVGEYPAGFDRASFETALGEKLEHAAKSVKAGNTLKTVVLYLAPGDYHYFHSPVEWKVEQRRHFPGNLLPVRPWAVEQVKGLYCTNERVVLNGTWEHGYFGFVAVGALNVGSIDLEFEKDLVTNKESYVPYRIPSEKCHEKNYEEPVSAVRGQLLGDFNLGSTVVLIFETKKDFTFNISPGEVVRVGQRIGALDESQQELPVMCPPWPSST